MSSSDHIISNLRTPHDLSFRVRTILNKHLKNNICVCKNSFPIFSTFLVIQNIKITFMKKDEYPDDVLALLKEVPINDFV